MSPEEQPQTSAVSSGVLSGIRVVELGRVLAAPFCGQLLGDAGADVVKIEIPEGGDEARTYGPPFIEGQSYYFLSLNRNKRSVTLNLKHEAARELMRSLLVTADVFLHNSLPGPIERLGLGYELVRRLNPQLIYCAISGFGQVGPDRDRPALDMMAQAESGIMSLTGAPSGAPIRAGVPIADLSTGLAAAYGIALALLQRQQTGHGQMVDASLLETSVALLSYQAVRYFVTGELPSRLGNAHPSIVPYDTYRCADGWVSLAVVNDATWQRFCAALDLPALSRDPRFASNADRVQNRDALDEVLQSHIAVQPSVEVRRRLRENGVPNAEVRDVGAVFSSDQVQALGLRQTVTHPRTGAIDLVASPVHLSDSPAAMRYPPPELGEHTEAILRELGLTQDAIGRLQSEGAI